MAITVDKSDVSESTFEMVAEINEMQEDGVWKNMTDEKRKEFLLSHGHDTTELFNHIEKEVKAKYLDGEITEEEYESKMSGITAVDEVAEDVENMKAQKYKELKEQYENDEISEEELDERMDRLFESGDDFLDHEETAVDSIKDTGSSMKERVLKYSLPICMLAPIVAVILLPGISPMVAIFSAVPLLVIGALIWVYLKFKGYL